MGLYEALQDCASLWVSMIWKVVDPKSVMWIKLIYTACRISKRGGSRGRCPPSPGIILPLEGLYSCTFILLYSPANIKEEKNIFFIKKKSVHIYLIFMFFSHQNVQPATQFYFWLLQWAFLPFGWKKVLMLCLLILGLFWCSVVPSVTFSSNLINFEKNPKNLLKKNTKKSKKSSKV